MLERDRLRLCDRVCDLYSVSERITRHSVDETTNIFAINIWKDLVRRPSIQVPQCLHKLLALRRAFCVGSLRLNIVVSALVSLFSLSLAQ